MNADLLTLPKTDPARILQYRDRQYAAELIAVALLHLDFFTLLNDYAGADSATVCRQLKLQKRPADVLFTLCRASGFIVTDKYDRHSLTQLAKEHLVKGSPWYLGPYYEPLRDTPIVHSFLSVLRTGKPANWQAKDEGEDWHKSMLNEEFAQSFTDLMNCRGLAFGQALAKALTTQLAAHSRVLDVAGGSGIYSATLVVAHPQLSATVLEQAPVDAIVKKELEKQGLNDRISVVVADMFEDPWPTGCDVVLFSNVLHDWDIPEVEALLKKTASYLQPGGLLVIHDAFLNDAKDGSIPVAEYSALLMNITQGRCYSHAEYASILNALDFDVGPYADTIANRGFMTAMKK